MNRCTATYETSLHGQWSDYSYYDSLFDCDYDDFLQKEAEVERLGLEVGDCARDRGVSFERCDDAAPVVQGCIISYKNEIKSEVLGYLNKHLVKPAKDWTEKVNQFSSTSLPGCVSAQTITFPTVSCIDKNSDCDDGGGLKKV